MCAPPPTGGGPLTASAPSAPGKCDDQPHDEVANDDGSWSLVVGRWLPLVGSRDLGAEN